MRVLPREAVVSRNRSRHPEGRRERGQRLRQTGDRIHARVTAQINLAARRLIDAVLVVVIDTEGPVFVPDARALRDAVMVQIRPLP